MILKISELSKNFKQSVDDPLKRKRWQSSVGIIIFTLFVLSSVVVSRSVQALNQAAGNYGYYGGTYGYNASTTSSDALPSAPTSLSSSVTQTTASLSWTAPTTTTDATLIATGSGSISSYNINYSTSSLSACSGGSSTTSTSASVSLSSLNLGTTYYVAVCAVDNNSNAGSALTGSFTTQSGGGGTSGGTVSGTITTPAPTVTAAPAAAPVVTVPAVPTVAGPSISPSIVADAALLASQVGVAQNEAAEATYQTKVASSAGEFKVTLAADVKTVATNFVTYGTSSAAVKLGAGERLAVVRDVLEILGSKVANNSSDLLLAAEQIASGQKPTVRNLPKEVEQLKQVLPAFIKLVGHKPNFKDAKEDLAWNTMQYRVRFARDLVKEKAGIVKFKAVFGKNPKSPLDWAVVRAWGYSLK